MEIKRWVRSLRGQEERESSRCHTCPKAPPWEDGLDGAKPDYWTESKAEEKNWRMSQDHNVV